MGGSSSHFAGERRHELCARNAIFAEPQRLNHVPSSGEMPQDSTDLPYDRPFEKPFAGKTFELTFLMCF